MLNLLSVPVGQYEEGKITNPPLGLEGGLGGMQNPLAPLFARIWQTMVIFGSLIVLIFLIWGAIDWLTSEGDPEKLKNARNKIVHSLFGLGILAASYAIIWFLTEINLFGFSLLEFEWPTP